MTNPDPYNYNFSLTQSASSLTPYLTIVPARFLDDDTGDNTLTAKGYRYAMFPNTEALVLVRPRYNRRWLKAWGCHVTDFDVFEVDTVVNTDGTGIVAAVGSKHPRLRRLFTRENVFPYSALIGGAA